MNKELCMNIVFLFNSDHEEYGGNYGFPIMEKILRTGILQSAKRNMRVSIGDVLTLSIVDESNNRTYYNEKEVCEKVYIPYKYDHLKINELRDTFGTAVVFCWLFQNITEEIALKLDKELQNDKTYLGFMDVVFNYGLHLVLFRNLLCEKFRLFNNNCSIFYNLGMNEEPDKYLENCFINNGFVVNYEDIGARGTIFDNYDTLEHFRHVEEFKRIFSELDGLTEDMVSNIIYFIEEIHPQLFNAFYSAAKVLEKVETEEDVAQIATSGRRLLQKIADYLFPAQPEKWKERDVGKDKYKNRIWAYIEKTIEENCISDMNKLTDLGGEADRLFDLFNKSIHSSVDKQTIQMAMVDIIMWLVNIIKLSPDSIKRPYLAYEKMLNDFIYDVIDSDNC